MFWLRLLVLGLVISLSPVACSDSSNPKPKVKPELVPKVIGDKVHFILGTTKFVIPKKYVSGRMGVGHNYLGIPIHASLHALLPNFEGYEEHNKDEFNKTLGWGRRLLVRLELDTRPSHYTVERLIENVYPNILRRNYIKKEYGLEIYPEYHFRANVTYEGSFHHAYFDDSGKPIILFLCVTDVPSPACKGRYDFNKEIIVYFDFHLQYLPQWKEIWQKLDTLLKVS